MKRDLGVVLVAAGESRRLPGSVRKPFRQLRGKPVVAHSLALFRSMREVREIVLVAHPDDLPRARRLARRGPGARVTVVPGGAVRSESVERGVAGLGPASRWVAVHDAARPCVSEGLVRSVLTAARRCGAAIPALPVSDTLKRVEGGRIRRTVPREGLWGAQTPQILRRDLLEEAFRRGRGRGGRSAGWTDDARALEASGRAVAVVPGERWNLKITTPEDLKIAAKILSIRLKRAR